MYVCMYVCVCLKIVWAPVGFVRFSNPQTLSCRQCRLFAYSTGLTGTIPWQWSSLDDLTWLRVSHCTGLSGSLPQVLQERVYAGDLDCSAYKSGVTVHRTRPPTPPLP
jgi:hypothetical protein